MERIPRRDFLKFGIAAAATFALKPTALFAAPNEALHNYLEELKPLMETTAVKIAENDLFSGFKSFSTQERLDDFQMYFPIYLGSQFKYGIPWSLLWVVHAHETAVSRVTWPEINDYKGAMQRYSGYPDSIAHEAAKGWEFLEDYDQRYMKSKGYLTNDYEEIFFAAWKLRNDADGRIMRNPMLSLEEAVLDAQYSYCAPYFAAQRIRQYYYIKSILEG